LVWISFVALDILPVYADILPLLKIRVLIVPFVLVVEGKVLPD
jgi:hypothetical protein